MIINPKVVDISHYDAIVGDGFKAVRRFGILGCISKASEGSTIVDKTYASRRIAATQAGLWWGCYHFIRPGNMQTQADFFLRCAKPDDRTLVSLDHETSTVSAAKAREFVEHVEKQIGRKVVLYSGNTIKEQLGSTFNQFWSERRLWLAQYSSKWTVQRSWHAPWLWQFTGDGHGPYPHRVPGIEIDGGLDISSYAGTDAQLAAEWTTDAPAPIIPGPNPPTNAPPKRFSHVRATEFGGPGDRQLSAYSTGYVDPEKCGVALPARVQPRKRVRLVYNGNTCEADIVDVGPWLTTDPYWEGGTRPRAETMNATNKAGIDLTPRCMDQLGVHGVPGYRSVVLDFWEFVE